MEELKDLEDESTNLAEEKKQMIDQNKRIKKQNQRIFEKITTHQESLNKHATEITNASLKELKPTIDINDKNMGPQASLMESFGPSATDLVNAGLS